MPKFTAEGEQQTFAQFQASLETVFSGYEFVLKGVLFGLGGLLSKFNEGTHLIPPGISVSAVASAAVASVRAIKTPILDDESIDSVMGYEDQARQIATSAEGIQFEPIPGEDSKDRALRELLWYAYSATLVQGDFVHRTATALVLTGVLGFKGLVQNANEVDPLFAKVGLKQALDYYTILVGFWVMASRGPFIKTSEFLAKSAHAKTLEPLIHGIFDELSLDSDHDLREAQIAEISTGMSGKAAAEAVVVRRPLLRLSKNRIMLLGYPYLRCQLADKLVTKAQALARDKYNGQTDNPYTQMLGKRFELFFGELCSIWNPHRLWSDFVYHIGRNKLDSPDWIAVERLKNAQEAVLFQLKCRFLRENCYSGASLDAVRNEIETSCSKTLSASIKFIVAAIEKRIDTSRLTPDQIAAIEAVRDAKRWTLVGVYPSLPPFLVLKPFREMVIASVRNRLEEHERRWFDERLGRQVVWHIFDIEEFQLFLTLAPAKRRFGYEMRRYITEAQIDRHLFIKKQLATNFRTYLIQRHPQNCGRRSRQAGPVPELAAVFDKAFEAVKARYGFSSQSDTTDCDEAND